MGSDTAIAPDGAPTGSDSTATEPSGRRAWPAMGDSSIEALKVVALLCMTVDHVNKYLLGEAHPSIYLVGRLAMPLFAFVLGYNLARPGAVAGGAARRACVRLIAAGAVAAAPLGAFGLLVNGWWPLNVLFTLAAACACIHLVAQGGALRCLLAGLVFVIGGGLVEYWWLGIACVLAAWRLHDRQSVTSLLAFVVFVGLLNLPGGLLARHAVAPECAAALAAVAIAWTAQRWPLSVPRLQPVYYVYFPLHLTVLLAIKSWWPAD